MAKAKAAPKAKASAAKAAAAKTKAKAKAKTTLAVAQATTMLEVEAATASKQKPRGRQSDDDRAALAKYLNDHFKGLNNEEKFVKVVNGQTLKERLESDRELWKVGELTMGKTTRPSCERNMAVRRPTSRRLG